MYRAGPYRTQRVPRLLRRRKVAKCDWNVANTAAEYGDGWKNHLQGWRALAAHLADLEVGALVYARIEHAHDGMEPEATCAAPPGVSAKDWEKLKEILSSDVGGAGAAGVPEDYRGLVKRYFQEVARGEK